MNLRIVNIIIVLMLTLIMAVWSFAADEQKTISLRFRDASLDYVLEFFANVTGYTIIKDSDLDVKVTIIAPDDIPLDEAFAVLDSILAVKGYTSVVREKTVKIVPIDSAKQEPIPTRVGGDPEEIPSNDTFVTQVIPLQYADATQLPKDLRDLIPQYGVMTSHARTNTLIITAPSATVKRLVEIIHELDLQMSDLIKVEVFMLQYADATTVANIITQLFERPRDTASASERERAMRQRFFRGGPGGMPGQEGGAQQDQSSGGPGEMLQQLSEVKAVADRNSNAVVVSASETNLAIIRSLIERLDQNVYPEPKTVIYKLNYADASDVADELNEAFSSRTRSTFTSTQMGRFGRMPFGPQAQQQGGTDSEGILGLPELVAVPDVRTNSVIVTTTAQQMDSIEELIKTLDMDIADYAEETRVYTLEHADADNVASVLNNLFSTSLFEQSRSTRAVSTGFGRGTMGQQLGPMGTAASNVEEAGGLTGNVKIVADNTTNSLLITTYARNFPAIENIIKELDVLLPQVLIEAKIIEVTLDDETQFGIEWKWEKEKITVGNKDFSQDASSYLGLSEEVYGLKYGLISSSIETLLQSLMKDTKVNIISAPRIMTQNNEEAVINVSQEVPFLRSTQETATGGVLTTYDSQDVGVILTVVPRINKSGQVSLDVNQQINSLIEFTLFNAPVIAKREASAYVTVKDGETIVIGGIIKDDKTETINKIPILGSIPFIGRLFQRKDTRSEKTELMVFITPHVVYTDEDAARVTTEQSQLLHIIDKSRTNTTDKFSKSEQPK